MLGDRYGKELERGALTLQREGSEAVVRYHDQMFPLSPESLDGLELDAVNRDTDALDAIMERQHYRLSYWRSAQEQLNYRRFFTIDSLIGLRVEEPQVFDDSHRVILGLIADGSVGGLRIDHVDGLRDPVSYLRRLRSAVPDTYLVVEKILATNEELPDSFPVHGTTGYDFIAQVDGLFVDAGNEGSLTALYHAFTGQSQPFSEVVRTCKQEMMASELAVAVDCRHAQRPGTVGEHHHARTEPRARLDRVVAGGDRIDAAVKARRRPARVPHVRTSRFAGLRTGPATNFDRRRRSGGAPARH